MGIKSLVSEVGVLFEVGLDVLLGAFSLLGGEVVLYQHKRFLDETAALLGVLVCLD